MELLHTPKKILFKFSEFSSQMTNKREGLRKSELLVDANGKKVIIWPNSPKNICRSSLFYNFKLFPLYAEKVWKIARPAANLKLKKLISTCTCKETNDILTISKLRKNVSKGNPGCICQFFSTPNKLFKKYFCSKLETIHCPQSISWLKIDFYPTIREIFAIEVTTVALHKRKFVEAKIAQVYP